MEPDRNLTLHTAVVAGIVRVIRASTSAAGARPGFHDLFRIGTRHLAGLDPVLSAEASGFVLEFIRDGLGGLAPHGIRQVLAGDYSLVWRIINTYLAYCGHPEVEPAPLPKEYLDAG